MNPGGSVRRGQTLFEEVAADRRRVALEPAPVPVSRAGSERVAVVVLNWNGGAMLLDCLESVRRSGHPAFVTILVDNGSRDGSPALVLDWANSRRSGGEDVRVVRYDRPHAEAGGDPEAEAWLARGPAPGRLVLIEIGANLGFSAGNNVALRYALARGYRYVMLLNNDATVEPGTLQELVGCLERHPAWSAVAPKIVAASGSGKILYAGGAIKLWQARGVHIGRNRSDGPRWSGSHPTRHLTGCCSLYRADLLHEVGLLDEDFFFGHEDVALSLAAARQGKVLGVDLDARASHAEGGSLGQSPRSVYYYNKYRLLLVRKYAGFLQTVVAAAFLITTRVPKYAFLTLAGRTRHVVAELRAYRDFFAGRLAAFDRERSDGQGGGV